MPRKRFDPRKLMELAVDVMVKSTQEPRGDGKASPLVGAVLWNDGAVDTANRSELRDGDHAEFTLLERKHRSSKLDDAVIFSTLEPCAPGARKHPKLSCAERIVLARIKEIWVGIEDPDPTVDRKGIKYLQDSGVKVHLFDRDLQERIREVNREFIAQAKQRAAAARDGAGGSLSALSEFETPPRGAEIGDLDPRAIEAFRSAVGKKGVRDRKELHRWLAKQGLLVERKNAFVPTGFGTILFGKHPRVQLPQAALLGTVQFEDGREELRDFDGPAIEAPEQAIQWLKDKLPNPISRTSVKRKEVLAPFYEILREGIVNALVHRDYSIKGAKCQLIASRRKVVVMSPGAPVTPVTMQQLEKFDAPMLSRNPVMHHVFSALELAEERGIGLRSMRARAIAAELPLPVYSYKAPYVVLTMYPDVASATADMGDNKALAALTDAERTGWEWLVTRETVTTAEYQEAMGLADRTARLHLKRFADLGLVRAEGAARARRYEVVRP
jgi:ATP-dependent DNA helicase RecG